MESSLSCPSRPPVLPLAAWPGRRGRCEGTLRAGWAGAGPQADLLFGGIQVLRSRLKELQHLITLRDIGGQLDQGLEERAGESKEGKGCPHRPKPGVLQLGLAAES